MTTDHVTGGGGAAVAMATAASHETRQPQQSFASESLRWTFPRFLFDVQHQPAGFLHGDGSVSFRRRDATLLETAIGRPTPFVDSTF